MPRLTAKKIDEICTHFDKSWSPKITPTQIANHIEQAADDVDSRATLAEELASIDMERRWQAWKSQVDSSCDPEEVLRELSAQARVGLFRDALCPRLFTLSSFDKSLGARLRDFEFELRAAIGDLPSPESSLVTSSALQTASSQRLHVSVLAPTGTIAEIRCWGDFHVGRQSIGEPPSPVIVAGNPQKIVCTSADDDWISRDQARIRLVSQQYSVVENKSGQRAFTVQSSHTQSVVEPGKMQLIPLPFRIHLTTREIRIER